MCVVDIVVAFVVLVFVVTNIFTNTANTATVTMFTRILILLGWATNMQPSTKVFVALGHLHISSNTI